MMTLIVVAMHDEVQTWIPVKQLITIINENTLVLITGIGKVNASSRLTQALEQYDIDKIINIGLSGATKPYQLNQVYVVSKAYYHDAHAEAFGYDSYQIPGMPKYFVSDNYLLKSFESLNLESCVLYTGDEFVTSDKGFEGLIDMEGTALYQVAYLYDKPIISFKCVSDVIGQTSYDTFDLKEASTRLEDVLRNLKVI
jgi:adenosylhomocysteine nucleosidase